MNKTNLRVMRWLVVAGMGCGAWLAEQAWGAVATTDGRRLPITEVVLYSSGVGYFDRQGEVEGRSEVEMRFKVDDVNDLLKSLVVQDFGGGRVGAVSYGSRDPLTKTLKSFGVDLTTNPTLGQLLNQVRGEKVEVSWPNRVVGTVLGIEKKLQPAGEKGERPLEVEFLNLVTEEGLQSVPMAQVQKLKLVNERLNGELRQALDVLASSHDTQKKAVSIVFDGEGKRRVGVSYIAQTPVWKTSYRLVLDEKEKPFLQGWAIVENTSDEDWEGVRLSLVSGRPISFVMDLYQPLYTTRPVVQQELYTSLLPQVYDEAIEGRNERALVDASPPAPAMAGVAGRSVNAPRPGSMPAAQPMLAKRYGLAGGVEALAMEADNSVVRVNMARGMGGGAAAASEGGAAGELFEYRIKVPVTLGRQKSAMLPIINQAVDGERVSIYNRATHAKHPLYGFRLKNSTDLHLMQGPITVFDGDAYAGDARIEDLAPAQERLISYGLDLKAEVEVLNPEGTQDLVSLSLKRGVATSVHRQVQEHIYNFKSRDTKNKSVLVEHPFREEWKLLEPKEGVERTREVYRIVARTEPGKTAKLTMREERQLRETIIMSGLAPDSVRVYLSAPKVSAKVKQALQRFVEMQGRVADATRERTVREQRVQEITQEQGRIRENMQRLASNSELYSRYVKKLDSQETDLEGLRTQIEDWKLKQTTLQKELDDYLLALDVE